MPTLEKAPTLGPRAGGARDDGCNDVEALQELHVMCARAQLSVLVQKDMATLLRLEVLCQSVFIVSCPVQGASPEPCHPSG